MPGPVMTQTRFRTEARTPRSQNFWNKTNGRLRSGNSQSEDINKFLMVTAIKRDTERCRGKKLNENL